MKLLSSNEITFRSTIVKSRLKKFCDVAYEHRVFASWGMMQDWYYTPETAAVMAIAYKGNRMVGAAILMDGEYHRGIRFGVFVKKSMRRKGIGKKLTRLVRKRAGEDFEVDKTEENEEFFDYLGL